ncbi:GH1 family beta-glucosidase [Marmoricola sp. RAF53]|uniref:GH1 family beta-glucosidase n=1 Tax=Marmoricola sp. RAF53 TaxID=3233059 RepID=UPI003F96641C
MTTPQRVPLAVPLPVPGARPFPDGFRWGTATAAYQIEGAVEEDGRGRSIWDTFVRTPGAMLVEGDADVACDHYHRYREDVALMRDLGATTYRFSISWPRIFPDGTGRPNSRGLDFYRRLVDALLEAGIAPYATLYHWDLPQTLEDGGGWRTRSTVDAFGDYAGYVAEQLGDRVEHFFTINEFSNIVDNGYGTGAMAPGLKLDRAAVNQVRHHVVLAHGTALNAIRAAHPGAKVGLAENVNVPVPLSDRPEDVRAACNALRDLNAGYLTVMMEGRYPDAFLEREGAAAPVHTDDELAVIGAPMDFLGVNIYRAAAYVRAAEDPDGYESAAFAGTHPHAASWHLISPESMYWGPVLLNHVWTPASIYITENGCNSLSGADGHPLDDTDRVTFLRSYLGELQRACADGAPVAGYFHWSVMDNFEWIAAYANRYGLYHVDYETQERTAKLSAGYFREVATRNAVV